MKILFIIRGEGRGHRKQAISLRRKLENDGHEIVGVMVGKSNTRDLPEYFTEKIKSPVVTFYSPNFILSSNNKKVHLLSSIF